MAKYTPVPISNLQGNPSTAQTQINTNETNTAAAIEKTLSRDGTSPNQMLAALDLNHNDVLNGKIINADNAFFGGVDVHNLVGTAGPVGPAGTNGTNGAAATVAVGTTTTLASGSSATAVNVGTTSAAVINFGIPRGVDGVGAGTVTQVAMIVPTGLAVAGTPVTNNGTFTVTWSGIIPVANGSTGIASYAVGDILYASAGTTLAKLAAVATGNVLISGGVTTAPSWGKVSLTTAVSGTLPIANGGTNITTYTAGDVLYASALNTLGKLGIGTSGQLLTVVGGVPAWSTPTGTGSGRLLNIQNFASNATYTVTAGTGLIVGMITGGGGAGGSSGSFNAAGGGGGGSTRQFTLVPSLSTYALTFVAGGATTFSSGANLITMPGGATGTNGVTNACVFGGAPGGGGSSGVNITTLSLWNGGYGESAGLQNISTIIACGGAGGSCFWSGGGRGGAATAGAAGITGSGGGGGSNTSGTAGSASLGYISLMEFS